MGNVKCEGCKFSGNCYQEECYAVIQIKCNDYEEVGKDDKLNEDIEVVEPKCKDYESYINGANQFRHQIKNCINNLVKEMTEVSE